MKGLFRSVAASVRSSAFSWRGLPPRVFPRSDTGFTPVVLPRRALLALAVIICLLPIAGHAAAVDETKVIYPKAGADNASSTAAASTTALNATTILGALVLAAGGVWLLLRSRNAKTVGRGSHALAIDETKPLGNRQYLVVASYEGRKFLLGVCPGRIDLLAPLDGSTTAVKSDR